MLLLNQYYLSKYEFGILYILDILIVYHVLK